MTQEFYGCIIEDNPEHKKELKLLETPFLLSSADFTAPEEIDPRKWHRIENQGPMGSCQGHAQSSVVEYAYYIATRQVTQFSPMFAYLTSQKEDGLLGSDRGSTIMGGWKAAHKYGDCPLNIFPYPNPVRYSTKIPEAAWDAASPFKIQSQSVIETYEDAFNYLGSGQGGIEIGIAWGNGTRTNSEGVMETYTPGGGGHAVCILGYSPRKDRYNRKYLWLANSWSPSGWGKNGWGEISPTAIEQMLKHKYTVMIGYSDLTTPEPRRIDWIANSVFKGHSSHSNVAST